MPAGPAIIGSLAEPIGLPAVLGAVAALWAVIAVLARFVLPRRSPAAGPPWLPAEILIRWCRRCPGELAYKSGVLGFRI